MIMWGFFIRFYSIFYITAIVEQNKNFIMKNCRSKLQNKKPALISKAS